MEAIVVSIGTELTSGQCVDTNAAWLSASLLDLGVTTQRHVTISDDVEAIRKALAYALRESDLVIATGGLGPTPDDLTREATAAAIHASLEQNAVALAQIEEFFARLKRPMGQSNKVQALIPRGCDVIPNPRGTAPGIGYRSGNRRLFVLPGVPSEMKAMFRASIAPVIRVEFGETCTLRARLLCFGVSEAKIGDLLGDLMGRDRNPLVGTTASEAIITVRIIACGCDAADARRWLDEDVATIRDRLGEAIFAQGEGSLQETVAQLLLDQGKTISTAESCTGGLIAKRLTDVPGSSAYFTGSFVAYSNDSKTVQLGVPKELVEQHGAVSEAVADAMASGCRTIAGTDFALATTGIAGPGGGAPPDKPIGLVYIALADEEGVDARRLLLGEHLTRGEIRDRSCKAALNLLRIRLLRGEST